MGNYAGFVKERFFTPRREGLRPQSVRSPHERKQPPRAYPGGCWNQVEALLQAACARRVLRHMMIMAPAMRLIQNLPIT